MLVVADATPLNILLRIQRIGVLEHLFHRIVLPPEVLSELTHENTPVEVRTYMASLPAWMSVQHARSVRAIPPLDAGEAAAICLAQEIHADALLMDERAGRRVAAREGLLVIGTLGVLERAADRELIVLADALKQLEQTDFRIDPDFVRQAIRRDEKRRTGRG